ncbi:DNA polymerase III delta subunit [Rhodovastum atsumiense]|uniref:DNA-directed DNA polymerase n=1 Tax=Rhodovastum atsumiense TaxID=504468 RepID=A0A5M6IQ03_9PROT|nr:DNA polymerase III subunit delta [Rhodovastum atsumiense]KAA5610362.1 DNA polymerase III subunit delta [Rhodovastum atsumiense]CAH2600892.1 DNA polymerase III delta subunit [Rhodovastum atsumiense]
MKLEPRRVEEVLRDPARVRAVLLYGDDVGLIRERGARLVRAVIGGADDPFRLAELEREGFGAIPAEMAALALTGGRRVVRVREATDAATTAVQAALSGRGEALLVLEAPGLASKSKLRALIERASDAVAIGCYPLDERGLEQVIRSTLSGLKVSVDDEAVGWLAGQLGSDRAVTAGELEKLALFVGPGGRVDLEAARSCVGDAAGLSLEDALFAATSGDVAATDRALELAMAEGAANVQVVRAGLGHIQRLQRARALMQDGFSAAEAARAARPPVFFRRVAAFTQALNLWSPAALEWAANRLWDAERACKRTGAPADTIARNAVIGLAQRAMVARRR